MIEFKNVSKTYATGKKALNNVSFKINSGTIVGVIGRNGAGKSTIFKVMSSVIDNFEGTCLIDGMKLSSLDSERISYLPEVRGLDCRAQVLEHLTDLVRYKGLRKNEAEASVLEWLKKFELDYAKYKRIDMLSKGNQQKLQFIVAVASKPEILILDEPFSGLDPITSDLFWDYIMALKSDGCTVVFSTHDLSDKMNNCDQFLIVKDGVLVENGTLSEIQNKYQYILEIKSDCFSDKLISDLVSTNQICMNHGVYKLRLSSMQIARAVYERLSSGFLEYFSVRNLTLNEIFREIHNERCLVNES